MPSLIASQILPLLGSGRVGTPPGSVPTPPSAQPAPSSITVSVVAPALTASALTGQVITLTATVGGGNSGTPNGGTVSFNLGIFGTVANVAVVNGVAQTTFTIPVGAATPNTYTVSATYSGNAGFASSTSSGTSNGTIYFCQDGASTLLSPTLQSFAVLAGSTVTNTGTTNIFGNVGVTPGTAVTGFPPGIVNGTIHSGPLDAVGVLAQNDLTTAFTTIQAETGGFINLTGRDLGGLVLTPGRYHFDNSAQLTGTLTLNDLNNPAARFDFQIGSTLTTASSSRILIINGGADNVYWEVGSSATLGTSTVFAGNILALTDITLNTTASIACGRALARNGAVTMDTNFIDPPASAPTSASSFVNTSPAVGGQAVAPAFFAYDPLTQTLTVTGTTGSDWFVFGQTTTSAAGAPVTYTFGLNGVTATYTDSQLKHVVVNGNGGADNALLYTQLYRMGSDGLQHEMPIREQLLLGNGTNVLQTIDAAGNVANLISLNGFTNYFTYMNTASSAKLYDAAGQSNAFYSYGTFSYLAGPGYFDFVWGAGATTAIAQAGSQDVAMQFDGSDRSTFIVSGMASSAMSGSDFGRRFNNVALGFITNVGIARHAGDIATVYDSALADTFSANAGVATLFGVNAAGHVAYFDELAGFTTIDAYSFMGGADTAINNDPFQVALTGFAVRR